jgi:hypothetical protein
MIKARYTCGGSIGMASCLNTEVSPNDESSLSNEDCLSQEEVNQDIYDQLGDIYDSIDLSELGEECLTYVTLEGKNIVKNVLLKMEEEICSLKAQIEEQKTTAICDLSIEDCGLILGDLVDNCGEQPTTLKELLQVIITQLNQ